jgi:hypothetical protein
MRLLDFVISRQPLIPGRAQSVREIFGHHLMWVS